MADIEFPQPPTPENPTTSPFTDQHGQKWVYNGKNWVRQAADPGIPDLLDPSQRYGQQYARVWNTTYDIGEWELVYADKWYLGPHEVAPLNDGAGGPLQVGHVYYNTTTLTLHTWNGSQWIPFSSPLAVNTVGEYVWDSHDEIPVDGSPTWPDDYGNVPGNWINGETFVTVYVDGARLINEFDATAVAGDYVVDYVNETIIFKNAAIPANSRIVIQVGQISDSNYISPEDNNTTGWQFVIDEDDMISDLDTKVPTQQSVKAYVDNQLDDSLTLITQLLQSGAIGRTVGAVFDFAGAVAPEGSFPCMGQTLKIAEYPQLYAILGDLWATTGGVANPPADEFRLPTQVVNNIGTYARGYSGDNDEVGKYYASCNKRHSHTINSTGGQTVSTSNNGSHAHTGSTNRIGAHTHQVGSMSKVGAFNGDAGATHWSVRAATKTSTSSGNHSHSLSINAAGGHTHTINLAGLSFSVANQGELEARPESVVYLKCIWADPQPVTDDPEDLA